MARRLATAVFALGCMHTSVVAALGLGELKLESFLNEPLTASVDLLNTGGLHEDQIRVRLATSDDFDKLGIDRAYFLTSIKFTISIDDQGRGKILLTSEDPVLEPYLDFLIEARWPSGRLLREYTVLVDPPAFNPEAPTISASEITREIEADASGAKKKSVAHSSGTQVTVAESELPAGEMPDRDYGSSASKTPISGDKYMIRRDDTLWQIAQRAKPEGISIHQTMLDIQRLNPNAFIGGNINRIKAGYIIYLPSSGEISSDSFETARDEVRKQNEDWRQGRDSDSGRSTGPSLKISAKPVDQDQSGPAGSPSDPSSSAVAEGVEALELERTELEGRVTSMEDRVETLQRIVSLKDDQIAALQTALAEAEAGGDSSAEAQAALDLAIEAAEIEDGTGELDGDVGVLEGDVDSVDLEGEEGTITEAPLEAELVEEVVEAAEQDEPAETTPVVAAPVASTPQVEEESGGFMNYVIGLLVLAGLGGAVVWWRRRSSDTDDETPVTAAPEREFDKVEPTKETPRDRVASPQIIPAPAPKPEPEPVLDLAEEVVPVPAEPTNQSYGQRKHDQYASDDSVDALAEAEIYIAYGRYPQAVELLKTAVENEAGNPEYHLKLLEIYLQMGETDSARNELGKLSTIGNEAALSRGEELFNKSSNTASVDPVDELALETDFGELEIEPATTDLLDDDFDLSSDFTDEEDTDFEDDGDDLVFAEGGNEMSTKMDLARAYLDMGDEDGARLILEEVVLEGSADQQDEARGLLERIG
ncbi:MAG: FimV/HubP family polar landmark protein [Halioglobus sp.]